MLRLLELWEDDAARDGASNMAVDDWLLENAARPVLRVYHWQPGWGSFGYFVELRDAERVLPGLSLVRRRTGGGIVDHRADWTYTLVVPAGDPLVSLRGGGSYRVIHGALAAALADAGIPATVAPASAPGRGGECFVQPVEFDLLGPDGRKIAGAGQRRTRHGLLHQGSLAPDPGPDGGLRLARRLASVVGAVSSFPPPDEILRRSDRFTDPGWHGRR